MYSIIANGREIGIVEQPTFIRLQSNGYYALCDESIAQGIAFDGNPYQLADAESMGRELPEVRLSEINAGARIRQQETVSSIAFVTLAQAGSIDDVTAGEHADMFAEWSGNSVAYALNDIVRFDGKLWKCIQAHTSQSDWAPGESTASLWKEIANPAEEWPQWSRPLGAHDCYGKGDKVTYKGEHYTSLVDGNVWAPDEYAPAWQKEAE